MSIIAHEQDELCKVASGERIYGRKIIRDANDGDERITRAFRFADLARYTFRQRFAIKTIDLFFYVLIRLICATVRFQVEGWEHYAKACDGGRVPIYAFWHNRIFTATYFWRKRNIVVMTSQSFDGEYIARFIQRFGYGAARGSTTRGGTGALIEMVRLVRAGKPAAFTVDGPKGPANIAQPGAILLAKKTGSPLLPFSINLEKFYTAPSWDKLQIPLPFTRAVVRIHAPIYVNAGANDKSLAAKRDELQTALEIVSE